MRSLVLKATGLCLLVFTLVMAFGRTSFNALPPAIAMTFAVGFATYHLAKYRPKHKTTVFGMLMAEACYGTNYWMAFLRDQGVVSNAVDNITPVLQYTGVGFMVLAALSMLAVRRPLHYQEGVLDFGAAVAVLTTVQWELHGRDGRAFIGVLTDFVIPVLCIIVFAAAINIFYRLFKDKRASRTIVAAQLLAASFCGLGNFGYSLYGDSVVAGAPMTEIWPTAAVITGGFLLCLTLIHPRTQAEFLPEENFGKRLSVMRWAGPAAVLVTNPAMIFLLMSRGFVPSLPLGIMSTALTLVVIIRINRLLGDREAARRLSEMGEQRLQSLVEYAADVIAITNNDGIVTYVSPGVKALLGVSVDELKGQSIYDFIAETDVASVTMSMQRSSNFAHDVALKRDDNIARFVTLTATDHRGDSSVEGWVWNIHDITDRKMSEEAMSRLALYDQLTGLPNRTQMRDRLEERLRNSEPGSVAVLFCDLDGFKAVNDSMGHDAGDEVLRAVAGRWSAQLRANDVLGRWGGDEFLVICSSVEGDESALTVADRLIASLTTPLSLTKGQATVGASVGVVMGGVGEGVDALLNRADSAMYVAKRGAVSLHIA